MTETPRFDLPPGDYPFTITAHRTSDNFEVWRCFVFEPCKLYIPPIAEQIGEPVIIRFWWPDGRIEEWQRPN